MAHRAEQRGSRVTDFNGSRRVDASPPSTEPSVPAALEKIASVSQRVLSKRIDLLMLDNHEMISRLLIKAAALSVGVVTAIAALFSALAALVMWLMPEWSTAARLGVFALVNGLIGAAVIAVVLRDPPKLSGETEEDREVEAEAAKVSASVASTDRTGSRPNGMSGPANGIAEGERSGR